MAGASAQPTQARLRMTQKARSAAGMIGRRLAAKVANCCRYGSAVAFAASGVLSLAAAVTLVACVPGRPEEGA